MLPDFSKPPISPQPVPRGLLTWLPPEFRVLLFLLPFCVSDYSSSPSCTSSSAPPTTNCYQLPLLGYSLVLIGKCLMMISDNLIK